MTTQEPGGAEASGPQSKSAGVLYGVGVGPGDPNLLTLRAAKLLAAVPVVAYHAAPHGNSRSLSIIESVLAERPAAPELLALRYPVTTGETTHPGGYRGALDDFYAAAAEQIADRLRSGHDVALLAEGDPTLYSSFHHMYRRLRGEFVTEIIPGIPAFTAAAAAAGTPLVDGDSILTILPGTLPAAELTRRLRDTDAAVVMKLGRTFPEVNRALADSGTAAIYVEQASTANQRVEPAKAVDPAGVPYFSLLLAPAPEARIDRDQPAAVPQPIATEPMATERSATEAAATRPNAHGGRVTVVGLGPGSSAWTTPEVTEALAAAEDIIGYSTYTNRVVPGPGQRVHASDNKVESERATMALDFAARGRRVVVVSSGDPGVFAMATAVVEAAAAYPDVDVRVLPGVTAASAVAARIGAPLGHDFAVLSLSDRLKPWSVIAARVTAALRSDLVIAIYNPASRQRREQVRELAALIRAHREPDAVVVVARAVGSAAERVTVTTAADFDPEIVDMRTLVLIGSSQTKVVARAAGDLVFTPRTYPADRG